MVVDIVIFFHLSMAYIFFMAAKGNVRPTGGKSSRGNNVLAIMILNTAAAKLSRVKAGSGSAKGWVWDLVGFLLIPGNFLHRLDMVKNLSNFSETVCSSRCYLTHKFQTFTMISSKIKTEFLNLLLA